MASQNLFRPIILFRSGIKDTELLPETFEPQLKDDGVIIFALTFMAPSQITLFFFSNSPQ